MPHRNAGRAPFSLAPLALLLLLVPSGPPSAAEELQKPAGIGRWEEIDTLVTDGRPRAALDRVIEIRDAAIAVGDEDTWTRALYRETELRTSLHDIEGAVTALRAQPWPEEPVQRIAVELLYAGALAAYQRTFGWEIGQRPRIDTDADLEAWHEARDEPEAAFEAALERIARVRAAFEGPDDRDAALRALRERLDALGRARPWWSRGCVVLAAWTFERGRLDDAVAAHALATDCAATHPESVGGEQCAAFVASLEVPGYSIRATTSDGPRRRSIQVGHRNLDRLWFRAYSFDPIETIERPRAERVLLERDEIEEIVTGREPGVAWRVELPATPDYRMHTTYVTPPLDEPALYLVVASAREDFSLEGNRLEATYLVVSDLVLLARREGDSVEVTAVSGATGEPRPGTRLDLYPEPLPKGMQRWFRGRRPRFTAVADADGRARLRMVTAGGLDHLLVGRDGDQPAMVRGDFSWYDPVDPPPSDETGALVYTDRAVYRPGQDILWKVAAYSGRADEGRFRTLPATRIAVALVDSQGDTIERRPATTNDFGTASGRFEVPAGRLLGRWSIRVDVRGRPSVGAAQLSVEEYKRPTFEVTLDPPAGEPRLGREVEVEGSVRYYFGLPVVTGRVRWRVTREPVYVYAWPPIPSRPAQGVAAGTADLDADGRFRVRFLPEADERDAGRGKEAGGMHYRYRLSVDVTDEGGETRSAERVYPIGFVAVRARFEPDGPERGFYGAGEPVRLGVVPPSAGGEVAAGTVRHGDDGRAEVAPGPLPAGAYRLLYSTEDRYGARFETGHDLVIAEPGAEGLPLAGVLLAERASVPVGETARLLVHSGLPGQEMILEIHRGGEVRERRRLRSDGGMRVIEIPVGPELRGGFGAVVTLVRDHQIVRQEVSVDVPWDDRLLTVELSSFRDRLRPGDREEWRLQVSGPGGAPLGEGEAEVLASMYDRSLDLFARHAPPATLGLYRRRYGSPRFESNLGTGWLVWQLQRAWGLEPSYPGLRPDRLRLYPHWGVGAPGARVPTARDPWNALTQTPGILSDRITVTSESPRLEALGYLGETRGRNSFAVDGVVITDMAAIGASPTYYDREPAPGKAAPEPALRTSFAETAFFEPHLSTDAEGGAAFSFTVPDSVTEWRIWARAITRDLAGGTGDAPGESLPAAFGLAQAAAHGLPFEVAAGDSVALTFPVTVSPGAATTWGPGGVAFRATARAGSSSDGEQRPLPILPSRVRLGQSRTAVLHDAETEVLRFPDLAASAADPSLETERLVVTVDGQLFYGVLAALPYLVHYPHECTEQTLNRFVSTAVVGSVFDRYLAVAAMAAMAEKLAVRDPRLQPWPEDDANGEMARIETPWLAESRGGRSTGAGVLRILDPGIAGAQRDSALARLSETQAGSGAFPWFPGGPPSPYMTLYILQGLARAEEAGVAIPDELRRPAWAYLHRLYLDDWLDELSRRACCRESTTFLAYLLSAEATGTDGAAGVFTAEERRVLLDLSFVEWRNLAPRLKLMLAVALHRDGRGEDARTLVESVMDSAVTTEEEGTYWAPGPRSWLWYRDTVETHAFALRTLNEIAPDDPRRRGLAQWLFLDKQLGHWKSTSATAEAIYALVDYLESEGELGVHEEIRVTAGPLAETFVFEPDEYAGATRAAPASSRSA